METRTLGRSGPRVGALGLGCMGMSDAYGPADRADIERAVPLGSAAGARYPAEQMARLDSERRLAEGR